MLHLGMATIVASDAHSARRPPEMRPAREKIEREWGASMAERLFERNPQALLDGEPLS